MVRRRAGDEWVSGSSPLVDSLFFRFTPPIQDRLGAYRKGICEILRTGFPRRRVRLGKDHGWIGHNGEIPGYNTYLFYHPDLDAVVVVEVNSDISSGKCPKDVPTMNEWPRAIPCELPADRIFEALAEALSKPSLSPPAQ